MITKDEHTIHKCVHKINYNNIVNVNIKNINLIKCRIKTTSNTFGQCNILILMFQWAQLSTFNFNVPVGSTINI